MIKPDRVPAAVAYYSMEVALSDRLPTFSGGLGVLAGDHLRASADRGLPMVAVTLLYNHGFFRQSLVDGHQTEEPVEWEPRELLTELPERVVLTLAGQPVTVRAFRMSVDGVDGTVVPVHFLDTDLPENAPEDRAITDRLYTADPHQRLLQEAVLGLGGPLMLEALGYRAVRIHHINEGHGALVPLALLARSVAGTGDRVTGVDQTAAGLLAAGLPGVDVEAADALKRRVAFTTHTPVPAGHDRFPSDVVRGALGEAMAETLARLGCLEPDGTLNMTLLAMRFAGFVNGVSLKHRDVTKAMFPGRQVHCITNGVHTVHWASRATAALFDQYLPDWRRDARQLHYAVDIPLDALGAAHRENKARLIETVRRRAGVELSPDAVVLGIARRFAAYKRNDLILSDPDRLAALAEIGPVQMVFAGKAHPSDGEGKAMLGRVAAAAARSIPDVTVAFVENYGMELGRLICAGSDVWVNNPTPPLEASGTSGMKAALNGVPSLSTLDGWWIEGAVDGVTGWTIGSADEGGPEEAADRGRAADLLYDTLEARVLPTYYKEPTGVLGLGRSAIALNGSFFSAQRMVDEYIRRAYGLSIVW